MKKYFSRLFNESKSIRVRITMYFLSVFFAAIILLLSFVYLYTEQNKKESARLYLEQSLTAVNENISNTIENLDRIISGSFLNYQFQSQLDEADSELSGKRFISKALITLIPAIHNEVFQKNPSTKTNILSEALQKPRYVIQLT